MKKFENEEINSETDNIITGKKENFNSEKSLSGWCKGENWRNNNVEWKIEYSVK